MYALSSQIFGGADETDKSKLRKWSAYLSPVKKNNEAIIEHVHSVQFQNPITPPKSRKPLREWTKTSVTQNVFLSSLVLSFFVIPNETNEKD